MLGIANDFFRPQGRRCATRTHLLIEALRILQERLEEPQRDYDAQLEGPRDSLAYALSKRSDRDITFWARHALHGIKQALGPQPRFRTEPFSAYRVAEAIFAGIDLRDNFRLVAVRSGGSIGPLRDDQLHAAKGLILDALGAAA